jgi:GNAT superfamily N-acetyltransferase
MIKINKLSEHDVDELVNSFAKHDWHKPRFIFEGYLKEQEEDKRQIWVARSKDLLGYVTLSSYSHYQPFFSRGIPEIMDLNVLPPFRNNGIASKLMDLAEKKASDISKIVGIGVGLYEGYGQAQRLYVKRGYVPDGRGPTYNYQSLQYGQKVLVDDDLVLWFEKKLTA